MMKPLTKYALMSFLLTATLLLTNCQNQIVWNEEQYINPVYSHEFPDPSIYRDDDGLYWVFATEGGYASSVNLIDWNYEGNVFITAGSPLWGSNGAHVWAPDVIKIADTYLYYYALSAWGDANPGIGYCYTNDLKSGIWHSGGKLFDSQEIAVYNSIDPQVVALDGKVYMLWGSFNGIYRVELTADGRNLLGGIEAARQNKVLIASNAFEGVYVSKINDYYYMFLSAGSCCQGLASTYRVSVFRSENFAGPFLDPFGQSATEGRGLIILESSAYFKGPGHCAVTLDDAGQSWMVYHSYSLDSPNRRLLMIDQIYFDDEGWPLIINNIPSQDEQFGPKIIVNEDNL